MNVKFPIKCEECSMEAIKGERYCKSCRKGKITEMVASGYFTPIVRRDPRRTPDMMELRHETAFGIDR
jgi:hypothetical protein